MAILFRAQIAALLKELKFKEVVLPGGAKMLFAERLDEGRSIAEELPESVRAATEDKNQMDSRSDVIQRLARDAPDGAIVLAFIEVDREIQKISEKLGKPRWANQLETVGSLKDRGLLDTASEQLFKVLRTARNAAAHGQKMVVTTSEALEFVRQCDLLKTSLIFAEQKL
jgi:hypothetical protein